MVEYPTEISVGKIIDPKKAVKSLKLSSDEHFLNKYTLIENFLLLNTRSRKASMFFIETGEQHKESVKLANKLGLGFKVKTAYKQQSFDSTAVASLQRAFTFTDPEKRKEIKRIHPNLNPLETNLRIDLLSQYSPMTHKKIASIIGYDYCCTSAMVDDLYNMINPDERILTQVKSYREKNKTINPNSFFVEEFVPCRPDCENAAKKGRQYESDLRNQVGDTVADIYRDFKLEHLRDVESGKIFEKGKKSTIEYGMFSSFDIF